MPDTPENPRLRWLAIASYALVAIFVVGPALFSRDAVTGAGVDLPGTIWMHWWVRTTVEHLTLPISTDLLFYPDGKNFFNDTGANFIDAYLAVPLQWIFGVPSFLDVLDAVVLFVNALAMHALVGDLTERRLAPMWAAAIAFEVNSYALDQISEGRPTQAMLCFAVLAVRHLLRLEKGTWKDAALFGLFTVLQGLTYWFMVYFLVLALLPLALFQLWRAPRIVAPRIALAIGVAVAIAAPFLLKINMEIAAGNVGRLGMKYWFESPAATPTRWMLARDELANATWLAMIGLNLFAFRRAWPWLLGVGLTLLFAVGARLDWTEPPLHNYFYVGIWETVPLIPRLGFPERALSMTFVLLAMGAGVGLRRLDAVWAPLLVGVTLAELPWREIWPLPTTAYPNLAAGNEIIRDGGGAVIFLPFGANEDAMVFQTFHGQPLFGGMGERERDLRPPGYEKRLENGFIIMLGGTLNDSETPIGYTREERAEISRTYRWVWYDHRFAPPSWKSLGYDKEAKLARLEKELGPPVWSDDNAVLWDLHAPVPDDAPGLSAGAERAEHQLDRLETAAIAPAAQKTRPSEVMRQQSGAKSP